MDQFFTVGSFRFRLFATPPTYFIARENADQEELRQGRLRLAGDIPFPCYRVHVRYAVSMRNAINSSELIDRAFPSRGAV